MTKYRLVGLQHPGRIIHPQKGKVKIALLSQEEAKSLFDEGCPFVESYDEPIKKVEPVFEEPVEVVNPTETEEEVKAAIEEVEEPLEEPLEELPQEEKPVRKKRSKIIDE